MDKSTYIKQSAIIAIAYFLLAVVENISHGDFIVVSSLLSSAIVLAMFTPAASLGLIAGFAMKLVILSGLYDPFYWIVNISVIYIMSRVAYKVKKNVFTAILIVITKRVLLTVVLVLHIHNEFSLEIILNIVKSSIPSIIAGIIIYYIVLKTNILNHSSTVKNQYNHQNNGNVYVQHNAQTKTLYNSANDTKISNNINTTSKINNLENKNVSNINKMENKSNVSHTYKNLEKNNDKYYLDINIDKNYLNNNWLYRRIFTIEKSHFNSGELDIKHGDITIASISESKIKKLYPYEVKNLRCKYHDIYNNNHVFEIYKENYNTIENNNKAVNNKNNINSNCNEHQVNNTYKNIDQQLKQKNIDINNGNNICKANSNPIELLKQGIEEKRKGNYKEAIKCYKMAENLDSSSHELYISMGKVYYILGQFQEATNSYIKCIQLLGDVDDNILMHLGHALLDSTIKSNSHASLVEEYRCSIDPYFDKYGARKYHAKLTIDDAEKYDEECIKAAYSYAIKILKNQLSKQNFVKSNNISVNATNYKAKASTNSTIVKKAYNYDSDAYYEEDGGDYDQYGYNREGYDIDGLDEYGYDEDMNGAYD